MIYKDKKVALLGLGEENIELLKYLKKEEAIITICDKKSRVELEDSLKDIDLTNIEFSLGKNYLDDLERFDVIFRTPGLPYLHEKIQKAKAAGIEVSSQTKLFFANCPSPIIGITGTKGKGTTTTLVGNILKNAGKNVFIGGNIGFPPILFLDKLTNEDIVVLELSSFQLQDLGKSPHIAVVLDIKIDHLDIHKDENEYIEAKRNIVRFQTKEDFAIINADYLTSTDFAACSLGKTWWFSRRKLVDLGTFLKDDELILRTEDDEYPIIKNSEIQLRGEHNLENIAAAITASFLAGADIMAIKNAVNDFKGLEHRLELVAEIKGVKYYNDSFSTTPDTTIAAINSFTEPIILLLGGSEKKADYSKLAQVISKSSVKEIIPIGLTAERIIKGINNPNIIIEEETRTLPEAFEIIKKNVQTGDIVLLSPASASFDHFKNYKDRGNQFKNVVLRKFS